MRKIILPFILLSLLSAYTAGAEENTLLKGRLQIAGNFSPVVGVTTLQNIPVFITGGKWTSIINHSLLLGSEWYITPVPPSINGTPGRVCYGGPVLGWIFFPAKILHFSVETLIGSGGFWPTDPLEPNEAFFTISPYFSLELNVTSHFHLALGLGYRYIPSQFKNPAISENDISGYLGEVLVKIGNF